MPGNFLDKLLSGGGGGGPRDSDATVNKIIQIATAGGQDAPGKQAPSFSAVLANQVQPGVPVLGSGPALDTTAGAQTFVGATAGGGTPALPTLATTSSGGTPGAPTLDFRQQTPSYAGGGLVQRPSYAEGGLVQPGGPPQVGLEPQGAPQQPIGLQAMEAEMQRMVQEHPQKILQMRDLILAGMQAGEVTMQELNMGVQLATAAAQNPQLWPQLRQFAIQQGLGTEQEIPQQYDEGLVFSLLLAARAVQQQGPPQVDTGAVVGQAAQGSPAVAPGIPQAAQGSPAVAPGIPQATGQPIPTFALGGPIPQTSQNTDGSVLAAVHPGEYVIPDDIVRRKGLDFFDKLVGKDNGKSAVT